MAGVPMRQPPGVMADTSPTTAFLFSVMWHMSHTFSILEPVMLCSSRSPGLAALISHHWCMGVKVQPVGCTVLLYLLLESPCGPEACIQPPSQASPVQTARTTARLAHTPTAPHKVLQKSTMW